MPELDKIELPTSVEHSTTGIKELAASIRAQHHNPENLLYHHPDGKPKDDLIANSELAVASRLAAAGVVPEAPLSPAQRAIAEHNFAFSMGGDNPHVEALIGSLTQAQESNGAEGMVRARVALRETMGFANYDALVALAAKGLPDGKVLSPAHLADPHILKLFAAKAQYKAAEQRSRPR